MSIDNSLSPELVYALHGNIAIPFQDSRSAATVLTQAQTRLTDAATMSTGDQTVHISAVTLAGAVKANR